MRETALDKAIMAAIRKRGGWCFKAHGGPYQAAGIPDIVGVFKGRALYLEDKVDDNDATVIQWKTIVDISRAGGYAAVVRSAEEAMAILDEIDREIACG